MRPFEFRRTSNDLASLEVGLFPIANLRSQDAERRSVALSPAVDRDSPPKSDLTIWGRSA